MNSFLSKPLKKSMSNLPLFASSTNELEFRRSYAVSHDVQDTSSHSCPGKYTIRASVITHLYFNIPSHSLHVSHIPLSLHVAHRSLLSNICIVDFSHPGESSVHLSVTIGSLIFHYCIITFISRSMHRCLLHIHVAQLARLTN